MNLSHTCFFVTALASLLAVSPAHSQNASSSASQTSSAPQAKMKKLVMLEFELIDDTLDEAAKPAQKQRLEKITQELRRLFIENKLYDVVDNAPAAPLIEKLKSSYELRDCNGCDVEIGQALGADRVMTAWVQKVSNLILNINIQIRDVQSGNIVLNKSVDIRSNTDDSWSRGIRYMVRSMVEKNQANR